MHQTEKPVWLGRFSGKWLLVGLLVFTLFVRGGVLLAMRGQLQQDPDAYREIAENLIRHGQFALGKGEPEGGRKPFRPTAYRPPLYPVLLSNLPTTDGQNVSLAKVAAVHLLLGVATVWLTWLTCHRLLDGRTGPPRLAIAPMLAGLIVACDPILLNQQSLVMTETLAAFLAALSLWCLVRFDRARSWFNAALAGGAIGLAVLCRPTFLPWLGLVGLAMFLVRGPDARIRTRESESAWINHLGWRFGNMLSLTILAAAILLPWAIRNYGVFGKAIGTTTHGGYTLLLGNNKHFYAWLTKSHGNVPWDNQELHAEIDQKFSLWSLMRDETDNDEAYYRWARQEIREHPREFALASAYRVAQLWSPLPHKLTAKESAGRRLLRYATSAWYCGVYVLAVIGIWRLRWKILEPPWIWGVLLCLAFTAVHTFYWTNLRMRAPLMPFVALVAAAATSSRHAPRDVPTKREENAT